VGLNFAPYTADGIILAIIFGLQVISILSAPIGYKLLVDGNPKAVIQQRLSQLIMLLTTFFLYVPLSLASRFMRCNFFTGTLLDENVSCWTLPNVGWAVTSYLSLFTQLYSILSFAYCMSNLAVGKKGTFFSSFGTSFVTYDLISAVGVYALFQAA
jgi:hypothetical protein